MKRHAAIFLSFLAILLVGCAGMEPDRSCTPRAVAALPMIDNPLVEETGSPVVSVEIGGRPRALLVDTGGVGSLLDPVVAADFQVRFTRSFYRLGLDAQPLDKVARVPSVRIGARRFPDISFVVSPIGWTGIDGTLGTNWLQTMDLEIDPAARRVVFYERDHCGSGAIRWQHRDPVAVRMRVRSSDQPIVPVHLDGREMDALVDTGTPDTVLSLDAARRLFGLGPDSPGILPGYSRALGGGKSEPSWRYRFRTLAIGDLVFDHPWVTLARMSGGGPELILGMEQLRRLHLFLTDSDGILYAAMTSEAEPTRGVRTVDYLRAIEGLIDRHQTDDAASRLDTLLAADPGNATAHMLRAALYDAKGDRAHGMQQVEQAIRIDPGFGGAYLVRSRLQAEAGDYERAFADADQSVRLLPKDATALNTRCWYGAISGRFDRALADCDAALDLAPKDANILDSRALVHLDAGRLDDAIRDYDAALAIDPKMASSLYGRGLAERGKGEGARAESDIAAAKRIEPNIAETFGK
ncbi:MAG TPA: aspartyl protease family protein [Alphaproteobacteria bacterium]|nr:aspartyl protease family protein [Alphaproteobacteria bacterium]